MNNVMHDLETLGTKPGSAILSIGAVMFDPVTKKLGDEFYVEINAANSLYSGLTTDPSTMLWWTEQGASARSVLEGTSGDNGYLLYDALRMYAEWLRVQLNLHYDGQAGQPKDLLSKLQVWGNGSDFDNVLLAEAYRAIGEDLPWKFYNNRCYRTLKNLLPDTKLTRVGTHHNALDDAKSQAWHAIQLLNRLPPVEAASTAEQPWYKTFWQAVKAEFKLMPWA